jgi:glutamine synthetase
MVRDGRIDTLVVTITDMQGRLMGKRVQAQAFLDGVIDHGATSAPTCWAPTWR